MITFQSRQYTTTVWSSELDTLLMRYGVKFTSYRIKSVSNSLDQTVVISNFEQILSNLKIRWNWVPKFLLAFFVLPRWKKKQFSILKTSPISCNSEMSFYGSAQMKIYVKWKKNHNFSKAKNSKSFSLKC